MFYVIFIKVVIDVSILLKNWEILRWESISFPSRASEII